MTEVILIILAGTAVILGMGVLSVRADRQNRKVTNKAVALKTDLRKTSPEEDQLSSSGMGMAAEGTGNIVGKGNLASISSHSS